ncbi:iron ABC transporter permease [Klebsiella variicola subsp. variicola]|nr:iron ABC transporter permease [Klebsiella variicola subsp. variicola]
MRLAAALLTGAALGVAGLLLQTVIRNPLGEPHILGLNAGASLAVVATSALGLSLGAFPAGPADRRLRRGAVRWRDGAGLCRARRGRRRCASRCAEWRCQRLRRR